MAAANGLDSFRQLDLALIHLITHLSQGFGNVRSGHGAEQTACLAGFGRDFNYLAG